MDCIVCFKEIGVDRICKYCGSVQYDEPSEEVYERANEILSAGKSHTIQTSKQERQPIFNDEEILALGLYPKDEGYKMSLISRILGKR